MLKNSKGNECFFSQQQPWSFHYCFPLTPNRYKTQQESRFGDTMIGRRDREGPLMRNNSTNSLRKSRVLTAVAIGVLVGCVFAFLFPNGFFVSDSAATNHHLPLAGSKTQVLFSSKTLAFSVFFTVSAFGSHHNLHHFCDYRWLGIPNVLTNCFSCFVFWIVFDLADSASFGSIFPHYIIHGETIQTSFIF